jgi:PAS domain-containing protein
MKPDKDQTGVTAEQALQACESRFRDFMDIAVAWFRETDEFLRLVRLEGQEALHPRETWLDQTRSELHGGDPSVWPWKEHIETLQAWQPFRQFEYQTATSDGEAVWVSASGRPIFAEDGTSKGYRGVTIDITAHKRAETEAPEKIGLLEATREHMDQGLIMVDATETVRVYNHRVLEPLELPPDLLREQPNFSAIREQQLNQGEFRHRDEAVRQWVESRSVDPHRDAYE